MDGFELEYSPAGPVERVGVDRVLLEVARLALVVDMMSGSSERRNLRRGESNEAFEASRNGLKGIVRNLCEVLLDYYYSGGIENSL